MNDFTVEELANLKHVIDTIASTGSYVEDGIVESEIVRSLNTTNGLLSMKLHDMGLKLAA